MIENDEDVTIQSAKKPNFLVPKVEEIEQVTLLSELNYDEMSLVERIILPNPETTKIKLKPLNFTVDENFFDLAEQGYDKRSKKVIPRVNQFIENRGFLRLQKERHVCRFEEEAVGDFGDFVGKHIELQFPAIKGFATNSKWHERYFRETDKTAKTHIYFDEIELVFFNQGFFKSKLIFTLKPEKKHIA